MSQSVQAVKKSALRQEGRGYQVFTVFNTIFLVIATFVTLYPMYYVVVASISEADELARNFGLLLYPLGKWNVFSYELVFRNSLVLSGFMNTFLTLGRKFILTVWAGSQLMQLPVQTISCLLPHPLSLKKNRSWL